MSTFVIFFLPFDSELKKKKVFQQLVLVYFSLSSWFGLCLLFTTYALSDLNGDIAFWLLLDVMQFNPLKSGAMQCDAPLEFSGAYTVWHEAFFFETAEK